MKDPVPIFDALAHPCLNDDYLGRGIECSFAELAKDLERTQVKWACAVGLDGIGAYSHEAFAKAALSHKNLFPVAAVDPKPFEKQSANEIIDYLANLKKLGFVAIKLHPRLSKFKVKSEYVTRLFSACESFGMPVFLCTYHYGSIESCPLFETLCEILQEHSQLKLLLVHSGAVEVLKYMELARAYKNVLLDLSLTMMKYEGSSIDLDIKFMFKNFDRRICVGSDHPEYTLKQFADRFNFFAEGISQEKKENIAYKNIANFLSLPNIN